MKVLVKGKRSVWIQFEPSESADAQQERQPEEILEQVHEKTGMVPGPWGIRFHTISQDEIVITGLRLAKKTSTGPIVYDFTDKKALLKAAEAIRGPIRKSSLYRMENGWRLLLWPQEGQKIQLQYGHHVGHGIILEAEAIEFGQEIRRKGAIEWLKAQSLSEAIAAEGSWAPKT